MVKNMFYLYNRSQFHESTISIQVILDTLIKAGLLPENACFDRANTECYCDDGLCSCQPKSLVYTWLTTQQNICDTCGATGEESCKTKSGRKTDYHKARRAI